MHRRPLASVSVILLSLTTVAAFSAPAAAQPGGDTRVSVGSPAGPFSQNKQNEPAVAIDPIHPNILVSGANDNIDMEVCNAGDDTTCPFTEGVGVSGVYFSFDSGTSWKQPIYTGYSARNCLGVAGRSDDECVPQTNGQIGTLPNYAEKGLVSDGDPALAFGPRRGTDGKFGWSNGSRLYYANLTSAMPGQAPFKGFEAIAVSHTDNVTEAANGTNAAWSAPVIASKQNSALFADKEQIWADNAASSSFFGNVYVCYAGFRSAGSGFGNQPLFVLTSRDGGSSWAQKQVTSATNNINSRNGFGRSGCTIRTDSRGVVYAFTYQFAYSATTAAAGKIQMIKSYDGGATWTRPVNVFTAYDTCNYVEASIGRCVMDGVGGARSDLSPPRRSTSPTTHRPGVRARPTASCSPGWTVGPASTTSRSCSPRPSTAAPPGAARGPSEWPVTGATTPRRRSRRTAATSGSCTTRSPPRSGRAPSGRGMTASWSA